MSNIIKTFQVSTIQELNDLVQNGILGNMDYMGYSKHFRGQADIDYKLQTRLADKFKDSNLVQVKANQIFNTFRANIKASNLYDEFYIPTDLNLGLHDKAYYLLFQAQHLGIPTPLMDWTFNWRYALYFVIENEKLLNKSGHIWVMLKPFAQEDNIYSLNPYFLEEPALINAPYDADAKLNNFLGEKRRHNQAGQFLIMPHTDCVKPLEDNTSLKWPLMMIEILPELKQQVHELRKQNVDDALIQLMQNLRLDFKKYDSQAIYGTMSDPLKDMISKTRQQFDFSPL